MQPQQVILKLREYQSHLLARKKTPADIRKRDVEACVLPPSIPSGRCVGAVWVAYWACQRYHHLCLSQQAASYMEFLELKKCFFKRGCFGWGDIFLRAFHEFAFSSSFVDPFSEHPAWTRRRRSDSQPICPPRTCAHLSPPGVPFSVLPPEKFGVSS